MSSLGATECSSLLSMIYRHVDMPPIMGRLYAGCTDPTGSAQFLFPGQASSSMKR